MAFGHPGRNLVIQEENWSSQKKFGHPRRNLVDLDETSHYWNLACLPITAELLGGSIDIIIISPPPPSSSPWEDPDQRVSPELLILTAPTGGGKPKIGERASQENVRDLDLERVHDEQYNPLS